MSEIKPIRLPVRYDPKRGVIRDEMGNIVAEIPVGFGDRVTIEKRNSEIGEQIAAALNAHEQLAEAKAKVARFEAMLANAGVIELMSGDCLERDPEFGGNWRLFVEGDGYNPATFGTAYEAFEATQEKTDG